MGMFSSLFGGGESKRAAGVAAAGQTAAGNLIDARYKELKGNYDPYMTAGTGALNSYMGIANGLQGQLSPILGQMGNTVGSMDPIIGKITSDNLNDYQKSPGYDFRMQQQQKALENSAAAKGTLFSGATGKALAEYGQNFGSNEYQNYLANLYNQLGAVNTQFGAQGNLLNSNINSANASLNAYSPIISTGYNAANAQAGMGMDAADKQGAYIAGAANTTAQGMMGRAAELAKGGQQWVQLGAMAVGGAMGGASGAMMGGQMAGNVMNGGQQGQQPYAQTQPYNQNYGSQPTQSAGNLQPFQAAQPMPWNNTNYGYNQPQTSGTAASKWSF